MGPSGCLQMSLHRRRRDLGKLFAGSHRKPCMVAAAVGAAARGSQELTGLKVCYGMVAPDYTTQASCRSAGGCRLLLTAWVLGVWQGVLGQLHANPPAALLLAC